MGSRMGRVQRQRLIRAIEATRGSRVITYVTGDRPSGEGGLGLDLPIERTAVPVLHRVLQSVGRSPRVDLFLYTSGGDLDIVWPAVSLIREYAVEEFTVLIPHRAHGAGTLLALGADGLILCEAAELGAESSTTWTGIDHPDAHQGGPREGSGVVSPGHGEGVRPRIRFLLAKLLRSGQNPHGEEAISGIVETLTGRRYSHTHAMNRHDTLKLLGEGRVERVQGKQAGEIEALMDAYREVLKLDEPQNVLADLAGEQQAELSYPRGFIESTDYSSVYESRRRLTLYAQRDDGASYPLAVQRELQDRSTVPGVPPYIPGLPSHLNNEILFEGWRENDQGE